MINVLHLGLSYRCNMKCKHCFVHKKKDVLKEEDYYKIIDTFVEHGLFVMYYTFGEPLLSDMFERISFYAHKKGLVQILMTNGSLINAENVKKLKENGISKVCVSIDHVLPQKHDENRNFKGAYDRAVDALRLLKQHGMKTEMSVTVTNQNVECLDDIYQLGLDLDVDYISYLKERTEGKNLELHQSDKYYAFFRKMLLKKDNPIRILFHDMNLLPSLEDLYRCGDIDEITYERYFEMNCCHSRYTMSVEPSGEVLRCNLTHYVVGNLMETPLEEIVKVEEAKDECISCCSTISK